MSARVLFAVMLLAWVTWLVPSAWASRSGKVDLEGAEVFEGPGKGYKLVDKVSKGTPVAASNVATEGYYKIRTATGIVGWVSAEALMLLEPGVAAPVATEGPGAPAASPGLVEASKDAAAFREKKAKHYVRQRFYGGADFYNVSEVNGLISAEVLKYGWHLGGELDFLLWGDLALVVRVDRIFESTFARDALTLNVLELTLNSTPVMLGMELELSRDHKFSTHFAVMGGLALHTGFQSEAQNLPGNNLTGYNDHAFTGLAKLSASWQLLPTWGLYSEVGYRILKTQSMTPGVAGNGNEVFKKDGEFVPLSMDLSGGFVAVGFSITY